jgi:hypothetical protein
MSPPFVTTVLPRVRGIVFTGPLPSMDTIPSAITKWKGTKPHRPLTTHGPESIELLEKKQEEQQQPLDEFMLILPIMCSSTVLFLTFTKGRCAVRSSCGFRCCLSEDVAAGGIHDKGAGAEILG